MTEPTEPNAAPVTRTESNPLFVRAEIQKIRDHARNGAKPGGKYPMIHEAAKNALARIHECENRIVALHYACAGLRSRDNDAVRKEFSALHVALYADINEAFRCYLMWGVVAGEEVQKQAKRMALRKYLSEGMEIMSYLSIDGKPPNCIRTADRVAFEAELNAIAKEKAKKK